METNSTHHSLVDVGLSWEVRRVATDVDVVRILINANPVDLHDGRERQVFEVDEAEVRGHAQVGDDVLHN